MKEPKEYLIYRYPNRKLYSKLLATYVTLTDIRRMVEMGCQVKVVNRSRKEGTTKDVTRQVLMDIYLNKIRETSDMGVPELMGLIKVGRTK